MKKFPIFLLFFTNQFIISFTGSSQNFLSWSSSFSPAWNDGDISGDATNINGSAINCNTICSISSGVFKQALGNSGAKTPTVSGASFTVPGSSNCLQICSDYKKNTGFTDVNLSFTSRITQVSFLIADIDKNDENSTTYLDQVTITGSDGSNTFYPTITRYDNSDPGFLEINGNTAYVNTVPGKAGNAASDATDQRGTIVVDFGMASITSIDIKYDNADGSDANPDFQSIAIGNLSISNSTLPVTLTGFSGHREGDDIVLNWNAEDDQSLSGYDMERNNNGSWQYIGHTYIRNSNSKSSYTYRDPSPAGTVLLYRLKLNGTEGRSKYSGVIRIINEKSQAPGVQTYPNPASSDLQVTVNVKFGNTAFVRLYDASGKPVFSTRKALYPGFNTFTLEGLTFLRSGIYYLDILDSEGNKIGHTKMLKQ